MSIELEYDQSAITRWLTLAANFMELEKTRPNLDLIQGSEVKPVPSKEIIPNKLYSPTAAGRVIGKHRDDVSRLMESGQIKTIAPYVKGGRNRALGSAILDYLTAYSPVPKLVPLKVHPALADLV